MEHGDPAEHVSGAVGVLLESARERVLVRLVATEDGKPRELGVFPAAEWKPLADPEALCRMGQGHCPACGGARACKWKRKRGVPRLPPRRARQ